MSRVKILHVLPWVGSGGVEKRRAQIIRGLDPARFEHRVLCKSAHDLWAPTMRQAGAQVIPIGGAWHIHDLDTLARILEHVQDWRPDIIHGAVFEGVVMAATAGYLGRVPHILIEETGATPHRKATGDFLMSAMTLLSDRCVAVSEFTARYLRERSALPEHKLRVVNNGVTFPRALDAQERVQARRRLGFGPDDVVIGSVGRMFNDHKRFTDLIEALARCPEATKLMLVGGGPDLDMLRGYARDAGVAARVVFTDRQSELAPLYGAMDVFALASAYESFGLVLVEAMSVGLPVVATTVGGIPDIVLDAQTGYLVEPGRPEQLAQRLRQLADDPNHRRAMGESARQRAHDHFSEARYLRELTSLYDQLLREGSPRRARP